MVAIITDCPMGREKEPLTDWRYKQMNLILSGAISHEGKKFTRDDFYFGYLVDTPCLSGDGMVDPEKVKLQFNLTDFISSLPSEVSTIVSLGLNVSKLLCGVTSMKDGMADAWKLHQSDIAVFPNYTPGYVQTDQSRLLKFALRFEQAVKNDLGIKPFKPHKTEYTPITELSEVDTLVEYCQQTGIFAFDFETTGVEWYFNDVVPTILSISFQAGHSYIIPLFHKDSPFDAEQVSQVFKKLAPLFGDRKIQKIGHNLKFDLHWMARYGVRVFDGDFFDTMLMAHLIDENNLVGLKDLTFRYFPHLAGYEQTVKGQNWADIDIDILAAYATIDTDVTFRFKILFERLLKEEGLYKLYRSMTMRGFWGFFWAEHNGAKIDKVFIEESISEVDKLIAEKESILRNMPQVKRFSQHMIKAKTADLISSLEEKPKGHIRIEKLKTGEEVIDYEVNFNSPTQMADLLYSASGFNFKPIKDDRGKVQYSTGKDIIKQIEHEFINVLLDYRTICKMKSTYYEGILNLLDENGFLHSSFLLHGTVTGRISSKQPNLQNIPSRTYTEDDRIKLVIKSIKKFFIPRAPGRLILQLDYSQAELRFIAHRSGDKLMIEAYRMGIDLHRITGARIFSMDFEEFDTWSKEDQSKIRKAGKLANFGLVYNISAYGYIKNMKEKWGITLSEDEEKIHRKAVFGSYPGLKVWHRECERQAAKNGYLTTLFGRKRRFLNMQSRIDSEVAKDIRDAINSPIQGSVGEIAVLGVGLLHQILPNFFTISSVHDSVIGDVEEATIEITKSAIVDICEDPPTQYFTGEELQVKMKVDINYGPSWGELN